MTEGEFVGQVAIVTGAARGLGFTLSRRLADQGCRVFMVDIDAARLERSSEEIVRTGGDAVALAADVTDDAAVGRLRETFLERGGRLDILVNNAGFWRYRPIEEITVAEWDRVFAINVRGVFLMTRAFMAGMAEVGYGRIVNIASGAAYRGRPDLIDYAAAKAAVLSLTRSFATQLTASEVLVNAVCPGIIDTETVRGHGTLPGRIASLPLGRPASPDDIAEIVLFLASARNRTIAGENVLATGGALMA